MRTIIIIFFLTVVAGVTLLGFSSTFGEPAHSVLAEDLRNKLSEIPTADPSATTTKTLDIPSFGKIYAGRGIHLIHDPDVLGREVIIEGPTTLVDHFTAQTNDGSLSLDFDRPIRSATYLTARVNLNRNGIATLVIGGRGMKGTEITMPPMFSTIGPLQHKKLHINSLDIVRGAEINVTEFISRSVNGAALISGNADIHIAFYYQESPEPTAALTPRLNVGKVYPSPYGDN